MLLSDTCFPLTGQAVGLFVLLPSLLKVLITATAKGLANVQSKKQI